MVDYKVDYNYSQNIFHGYTVWHANPLWGRIQTTLKSRRLSSAYISEVMVWYQDEHPQIPPGYFADLQNYLQFFARFVVLPPAFIERHQIKPYHISLLRRMYMENGETGGRNFINLGYKRPYGNSSVLSDLEEEYHRACPEPEYTAARMLGDEAWLEKWRDQHDSFLHQIHTETMTLLDSALRELTWPILTMTQNVAWTNSWVPTLDRRWLRAQKLTRVLSL